MSRLTRLAAARRPEEAILDAPVRDAAVTAALALDEQARQAGIAAQVDLAPEWNGLQASAT